MVQSGLDRLGNDAALARPLVQSGARVGLLANPTAQTAGFEPAGKVLEAVCSELDAALVRLFAPEHGFYGEIQAGVMVGDSVDPYTSLPITSLYGPGKTISPDLLGDLDVLFYDLQDVGLRWYTYLGTLVRICRVTAELRAAGRKYPLLVVLDRPNPLGGLVVEGGALHPAYESLVGPLDIPVRHGMTVGEIGRLLASESGIAIEVIKMSGWRRGMLLRDSGLPWIPPSPNLPQPESVLAYAATCLLEGTNVSEGRGTTRPFEIIGAPWVDPFAFKRSVDALGVPGLRTRPVYFVPTFSKYQGERCGGVHLYLDRQAGGAAGLVELGCRLLGLLSELYPAEFRVLPAVSAGAETQAGTRAGTAFSGAERPAARTFLSLLSGSATLERALRGELALPDYLAAMAGEAAAFEARRREWLLYE